MAKEKFITIGGRTSTPPFTVERKKNHLPVIVDAEGWPLAVLQVGEREVAEWITDALNFRAESPELAALKAENERLKNADELNSILCDIANVRELEARTYKEENAELRAELFRTLTRRVVAYLQAGHDRAIIEGDEADYEWYFGGGQLLRGLEGESE